MTIHDHLAEGAVVILDGGIGTEIQRRGVRMDQNAWCGGAHLSHPEIVRQVHADYIRAGARVITTNTFATSRHVLQSAGLGERFEEVNRRAVEVAKEARDNAAVDSQVWIAGSLSAMPPLTGTNRTARGPAVEANYRDQAAILAEAGADVLLAEMMMDEAGAAPVVRAAAGTGLPLWVGFSAARAADGSLVGWRTEVENKDVPPEDFDTLVERILALGGSAAGVMHSDVEVTAPALDVLAEHWDGPTLAYAETGRFANPEWVFEETCAPDAYAEAALGWVANQGVQIVGGCCGTGPEHIRALRERLPARLPDR